MKPNRIRIAIQKDGRMKEESLAFLRSRGLEFERKTDQLIIVPCQNGAVEILMVRHSDIPQYVQSGVADFGIVGENILREMKYKVMVVRKLAFGQCALVIAAPEKSNIKEVTDLEGERIATTYPNYLRQYLKQRGLHASIISIGGSVEAAPALNLADAICDLTRTGNRKNLRFRSGLY
jgi:ATP phosphoribosyltransferase